MSRSKAFYKFLRLFLKLKSKRLKVLALLMAHLTGRRYIGIYLDPVMVCNLKCRMCYFSDEKGRPKPGRPLTQEQLDAIICAFFSRALKLQIGCGAEPTVYANLPQIIRKGKEADIPYIELTTNGQLLDYDKLKILLDNGLDGITLSLHGTTAPTYEYLMQGAKFERMQSLLLDIARLQKKNPGFSLRVNYTINNMNFRELSGLFDLLGETRVDVLQVRPIQQLGDTSYKDFNLDGIIEAYDKVILPLRQKCIERNVSFLMPTKENLLAVNNKRNAIDALVEDITYCYISNCSTYKSDFKLHADTFDSYWKRNKLVRRLISLSIKGVPETTKGIYTSKKMNYTIS